MKDMDWFETVLAGLIAALLGAISAILFSSCAGTPVDYHRGPLAEQILRPLPGHTGLVNSQCTHDIKTGSCVWDYADYDLNDAPTRQRLRDAGMVCYLNGMGYRIASLQPGLIFERHKKNCVLGVFCGASTDEVVDYIPVSDYQKLLDGATECRSIFVYKE